MCGFAGFLSLGHSTGERAHILSRMGDELVHRGPDDSGSWTDTSYGFSVVHRRLSVVDLSPKASQPMLSRDKRYVIAYNGEIYNFRDIRAKLIQNGYKFISDSDTEVILASIMFWGLEKSLGMFFGMFAFVLFDRQAGELILVRDRIGEKPLYFGWQGNTFLFGSELKALRVHPAWQGGIDREALSLYFQYRYIPTPLTIHPNIEKLEPGKLLRLKSVDKSWDTSKKSWWSYENYVNKNVPDEDPNSRVVVDSLDDTLRTVLSEQRLADVPIGALLSGGIDSSLVVALMSRLSEKKISTFTIGYQEPQYDESKYAKSIATHLGTDHHELILSPQDVTTVLPQIAEHYDEPFADSSQIPTVLVTQLARSKVTVALSGDGGDEVFGGYNRYKWAATFEKIRKYYPDGFGRLLARSLDCPHDRTWFRLFNYLSMFIPRQFLVSQPVDKIHKVIALLNSQDNREAYNCLTRIYDNAGPIVKCSPKTVDRFHETLWSSSSKLAEQMMRLDMVTYLPDDILVKVDRASMATSLEIRAPFIDLRVLDFAQSLPLGSKVHNGTTKVVLRELLKRYVPDRLMARPKQGFALPISKWLSGPLNEWTNDMLSTSRLDRDGYLNSDVITKTWQRHLSGEKYNQEMIWSVLMFQTWLDAQT